MTNVNDKNTVLASTTVRPSPLLFWLTVQLQVTPQGLSGKEPTTIFGIIPAGSRKVSYALKQISGIAVETKVSVPRIIFGLIFAFLGIAFFSSNAFLGFIVLLIGAALFVAGLTAALAVTNTGGVTQYVKVSLIDRARLEEFAASAQTAVLDAHS
ncbi:MAG: hypothetical protein RR609_07165 [Aurantimicrobium sp.]|uniref:hypothetical protein n=1 Tax=Aurantimicrobium sp. TaxID=1930784 RepID=UPI002FC9F7AB